MTICVLNCQKESSDFLIMLKEAVQQNQRIIDLYKIYHQDSVKINEAYKRYDVYFILLDAFDENVIKKIEMIRRVEEKSYFVFVLKKSESITDLIRPSIRPSAILVWPVSFQQLIKVINEIHIDQKKRLENDDTIMLKIEGEIYNFSLSSILYFEARNKKMILRTLGQEISFYSTFTKIKENLNDSFVRCHKGFMVNCNEIKQINKRESLIILNNDIKIPFSRSYKKCINDWIERNKP